MLWERLLRWSRCRTWTRFDEVVNMMDDQKRMIDSQEIPIPMKVIPIHNRAAMSIKSSYLASFASFASLPMSQPANSNPVNSLPIPGHAPLGNLRPIRKHLALQRHILLIQIHVQLVCSRQLRFLWRKLWFLLFLLPFFRRGFHGGCQGSERA